MLRYTALLALLFCFGACSSNSKPKTQPADSTSQVKHYLPVLDYIKNEIKYVDSFPVGITMYNTVNGKTDSAYIKTPTFDSITKEFLLPELDQGNFEKEYTESSFYDQTTDAFTFVYSTPNKDMNVKTIHVLASPQDGADKVKSIYIERVLNKKDTQVVEKLYWKTRKNFQLSTTITPQSGQPVVKLQRVVWDNTN